jgi:hypothetical protein
MKRHIDLMMTVLALALMCASALAVEPFHVKGTLVTVDAVASTIRVQDDAGIELTIYATADTKIKQDGVLATLADLRAESNVKVRGQVVNGLMVADTITARTK